MRGAYTESDKAPAQKIGSVLHETKSYGNVRTQSACKTKGIVMCSRVRMCIHNKLLLNVQLQLIDQSGPLRKITMCTYSCFNVILCGLIQLTVV